MRKSFEDIWDFLHI